MRIAHLLFIISMIVWPLEFYIEGAQPGMTKPKGMSSNTAAQAVGWVSLTFYPVGFT